MNRRSFFSILAKRRRSAAWRSSQVVESDGTCLRACLSRDLSAGAGQAGGRQATHRQVGRGISSRRMVTSDGVFQRQDACLRAYPHRQTGLWRQLSRDPEPVCVPAQAGTQAGMLYG